MPSLAEVSITSPQNNPAKILDVLALKTTNLIRHKLHRKVLPVDHPEPVLKANPGLFELKLKARDIDSESVRIVLGVCSHCAGLKELRISDYRPILLTLVRGTEFSATVDPIEKTRDGCVPFRRRNTVHSHFRCRLRRLDLGCF